MQYIVRVPYYATHTVNVEADSEDEAIDKALLQKPSTCNQCSNDIEIDEWNENVEIKVVKND